MLEYYLKNFKTFQEMEGRKIALKPLKPMKPRRERELFVKWKYMSYWHCEWVNEVVLDVHFPQVPIEFILYDSFMYIRIYT